MVSIHPIESAATGEEKAKVSKSLWLCLRGGQSVADATRFHWQYRLSPPMIAKPCSAVAALALEPALDDHPAVSVYVGILEGEGDVWSIRIQHISGCHGGDAVPPAA
jgi:hypothetical protein